MRSGKTTFLILLNKDDKPGKLEIPLSQQYIITDYWTDEKKATYSKIFDAGKLPAHLGRIYKLVPIGR
ncbi:MAG: hypothetical protein ABIR18_02880 [Chitinophagaceae bacterium]